MSRLVPVLSAAALTAASAAALGPAAHGAERGEGTLRLDVAKSSPVKVTALDAASAKGRRFTLDVSAIDIGKRADVRVDGRLRFRAGKRKVTYTSLRVRVSSSSKALGSLTGRRGGKGKRTTIGKIAPRKGHGADIDRTAGTAELSRARLRLTKSTARSLRRGLRLDRTPSWRRTVATVTVDARERTPEPPAPAPAPVPVPVTPDVVLPPPVLVTPPVLPSLPPTQPPAGPADSDPDPEPGDPDPNACWNERPATPVATTDWISCSLPGGTSMGTGSYRSWINYLRAFGGDVVESDGATQIDPAVPYDHRLPVVSTAANGDGSVTITHDGRIAYSMPAHQIAAHLDDLRIDVSADRSGATVTATAQFKDRDAPSADPPVVADKAIATIDLTDAVDTTSAAGTTTYVHAPATLTAEGQEVFGSNYAIGAPWGAFTVAVPSP